MKYLVILIALFVSQAFATDHRVPPTEPHYWMKNYPNSEPAKVQRCLAEAQTVFYEKLSGGMSGVAWAVLHKGNTWERCMEAK